MGIQPADPEFTRWFDALEARHLRGLTFQEVRRGVQALSSLYVERRDHIGKGAALEGAGKRAAFAYYFGPLHFLLVREIVRALGAGRASQSALLDLGCGTGIGAAAWALEMVERPKIIGVDRNPWAAREAKWTYSHFDLRSSVTTAGVETFRIPGRTAVLAAFVVNELPEGERVRLRHDLVKAAHDGAPILVIEPIAKRLAFWWTEWASEFVAAGGRDDEWRFPAQLPERLALMDKAAGLNHRYLTGRSLWLPGRH